MNTLEELFEFFDDYERAHGCKGMFAKVRKLLKQKPKIIVEVSGGVVCSVKGNVPISYTVKDCD